MSTKQDNLPTDHFAADHFAADHLTGAVDETLVPTLSGSRVGVLKEISDLARKKRIMIAMAIAGGVII